MESQNNTSSLRNYVLGRTIGSGSFARVKQAVHKPTGIEVAIKIISKQKIQQLDMQTKVDREIQIMSMFQHPHVIKLYEVIDTPQDIYLVQELAENGELFQQIIQKKQLSEEQARRYFQQLMAAVDYLHRSANITHRDLKSENVMLNKYDSLKITDFGLSNIMLEGDFLHTSCGSPNYVSPQLLAGEGYLGPPCDMWSCGVILYSLLVGKLPFDDPFIPTLFRKIRAGDYAIPEFVSPAARDLIKGLLTVSVEKRFTMEDVYQHAWFQVGLPEHLRIQFEQGYEAVFGIVNDHEVLESANKCMGASCTLDQAQTLLKNERTTNEFSVCYRLIFDQKYEEIINKIQQSNSHDVSEFTGVVYETFAKPSEQQKEQNQDFLKNHMFFFGQKLCSVSDKLPHELMVVILQEIQKLGFKWRMGNIVAYKYYDEVQKKDLITLKLESQKQKNPFQFCIRIVKPMNYLEYELIIGCCVYIAPDAKKVQQYVLDMRKITGELTMFQYQTSRLSEAILAAVMNNIQTKVQ